MRYQLRDLPGASRSSAYLLMAGGPLLLLTGVVLAPGRPLPASLGLTLLSLVLFGCGAICRWWPERVPRVFWLLTPLLAAAMIAGLNLGTHDASTGAQLFYLWPVLYAANFLSRTFITLTLAIMSAGHAAIAFPVLGTEQAFTDWLSLTVAFTLTAVVVAALRIRNDRLHEVLETQALEDPLTGVANRRSFDFELSRAVARSHRTDEPLALLTLDIDHFKSINDTWGHAGGDQALTQVAEALTLVARRDEDVVARLGGDEFVLLMRTDRRTARQAADDIRETVARTVDLPGGPPGLSIGVAVLPDHAGTAAELLAASDAALYEAKTAGRGRTAMAHAPVPHSAAVR